MSVGQRPGRRTRRRPPPSPAFEQLEDRTVLSGVEPFGSGAVVLPADPTVQVSGSIAQAGGQQLYQVTLDTQGLLVATVHASGIDTLLSLEDDQGRTLIQSEASSPTNPDDRLAQHLPAGTYYLSVSGAIGVGGFNLSTTFTPALAPGKQISEGQGAFSVTAADLNEDGKPDLVMTDYYYSQILINYGLGDGTFQPPVAIPVGNGPADVLAVDLSNDGHLDLVVANQLSNDITILKGDGQGDFQVSQVLATRPGPVAVVAGDFSGDGDLDLAVADGTANGVEIFHNQGNGMFVDASFIGSIGDPTALTVANLTGGTRPGLAVASGSSGNLVLLDGEGNDEFAPLPYELPVGPGASDVITAKLTRSGLADLVAVSPDTGKISIFHFDGFAYRLHGTLTAENLPQSIVAADFNGDGRLDLAAASYGSDTVSVFLGNGNDTFGVSTDLSTGAGPIGLAVADFNGEGRPDIVTSNFIGLSLSVFLNNGDGTFQSPPRNPPSAGPEDLITADLSGNGIIDLIVPEAGLNEVSVFLGRGDGTFRDPIEVPAGDGPNDVAVGDFTGDGIPDLAVADYFSDSVLILKGKGDGTFKPMGTLATGDGPEYLKTADLDGDGHLDLILGDYLNNDLEVFYGRGDGRFSSAVSYPVGLGPSGIAIGDFKGNGKLDIAVSDSGSDDVEVLMANGPRSFAAPVSYPAGSQPWFVTAGHFINGGPLDLIVTDGLSTSPSVVSLLVGNGDGTFQAPVGFGVGGSPYPLAVGDFTGDGNLDVVTGNDVTNDISVLLGKGNGTFQPEIRLPGGLNPYGIAVGDFNRDGKLDFIVVNYESSDLTIYLGYGNGSFETAQTEQLVTPDLPTIAADLEGNGVPQVIVADPQAGTISVYNSQGDGTLLLITTIDVGGSPSGLAVGDFNGDGRLDLAVTDASSGEVLILLGLGDGTFQSPIRYSVGKAPQSPVVGDFTHNGILDIAVVNTNSNSVSILYGRGDGTFEPQVMYPVGNEPVSLVEGVANLQGLIDLGVVDRSSHDLTELVGLPGGGFLTSTIKLSGVSPSALLIGDFNGDGHPDLAIDDEVAGTLNIVPDLADYPHVDLVPVDVGVGKVLVASADLYHHGEDDLIVANLDTGIVTVLSGWTNKTFQNRYEFQVEGSIAGLSVVDLNDDGLPDILITEAGTGQIATYLSDGNGVFSAAESTVPLPHPAPIVFPVSPGVSDIVNINNNGEILDRVGLAGAVAEFGSPINETQGRGVAIRDFTYVQTGGIPDVASLDAQRPLIYVQSTVDTGPSGVTLLHLPAEGDYTRLISGDLFGTGLDDLVVINHTLDEIIVFEQTSSGVFRQYGKPIPVGFGPTDVTLAYLNPGGLPDLVVADGSSGEVTLIARDSQGGFVVAATLPAGIATAGTVLLPQGLTRTSPDEPVGVTSGVFGPSGLADVVVVNHGTDQISILRGLPGGGLAAPSAALTYSTGLDPIQVVAARLTKSGLLDLVVLNEGSNDISIFLNNGHGGFIALPRIAAGDYPTSLAVSDVTGNGFPDLVVSNGEGDILILANNGDGTFQPYERADDTVNLAVGDLNGNGQNSFVLTNTAQDLLTVQNGSSNVGFIQGRGNGLLAPGPVVIADLNGDGISDLIVSNTGGNDVFVYLGLGNGQFAAPQQFFTGTAPEGVTVADLTGNGLPDLIVANSGSNDVTILLGEKTADGGWTLEPGPRLKAGDRPVSTTVCNISGVPGIVVVNEDSDTVTLLQGLGGGFFDDNDPITLTTGLGPVEAFVGHFTSLTGEQLVIVNSLSNDLTFYSSAFAQPVTIAAGGIDPVSGVVGEFNNDGFTDLAVADNGDSRITLFDGGPAGLSLARTIFLGESTHPTDLVASGTKNGGLQLFVGAEGQDQVIAVDFSSGSIIDGAGPVPTGDDVVNSGSITHLSSDSSSPSAENSEAFLGVFTSVSNVQAQESATAAQSSGVTSAVSLAAAVVTTLSQSVQPLFTPSSRTLGWLLDNLVQLAQGQTAEILPLGKDEIAAVAVLLSASSIADPFDGLAQSPPPIPTEDDAPIVLASFSLDTETPSSSRLDRFVANLGASASDLSREIDVRQSPVPEFGLEWVWHRRPTGASSNTATFADEPDGSLATHANDQAGLTALTADLGPFTKRGGPAESFVGREPSFLPSFAATLTAVAAVTISIIIGGKIDTRALGNLLKKRSKLDLRELAHDQVRDSEQIGTNSLNLMRLSLRGIASRFKGPMSTRHRPGIMPSRRFQASSARKRGQGE